MPTSHELAATSAASSPPATGEHARPAYEPTLGELIVEFRRQREAAQARGDAAQADSDRHQREADAAYAEVERIHEKELLLLKKIPKSASDSAPDGLAAPSSSTAKTKWDDKAGGWLQRHLPKLFPIDNPSSS